MTSIEIDAVRPITADELNGKKFTIISSLNSASAGTLVKGANYPSILKTGDIPALIDFVVIDANTNGKPDLTLYAQKDYANMRKNTGLSGSRNRTAAANLLINSANAGNVSGNSGSVGANAGNISSVSMLNQLTNGQVASHLESIHPEPYSSYMTISLEHSEAILNGVLGYAGSNSRVRPGRGNEIEDRETHKRFWMDAGYTKGEVDGATDLGGFGYSLSSVTIGNDLSSSHDRNLGAYFSFGSQAMNEHDRAVQSFNGEVYHAGGYLNQRDLGGWDLSGVMGYGYGINHSKRRVVLGSTSTTPAADYTSHTAYAGLRGTMTAYRNNWITLAPELGFNYIYYYRKSIKESGEPALSLVLDTAHTRAIVASTGVQARLASISDSVSIFPLAFVRYEHDFYANTTKEHEINAALVANPDYKQSFSGRNRGPDAVTFGLGLGSDSRGALQLRGGIVYSLTSHGREWGGGFSLEYHW